MGRKKSEEEDRIEQLEEQLRILKAINKSLVRRLKKLDKKFVYQEFTDSDVQDKFTLGENDKVKLKQCPFCKKIELEEFEVAGRRIGKCSSCGKRTKAEKAQ